MKLKTIAIFFSALFACACTSVRQTSDIQVVESQFIQDGEAQYFIGTNLWYAGRLASTAEGYARLEKELDDLHALGIDNLRVLAVEGEDIEALGKALKAMEQRGMKAVLFLNNAWEWSFGFADYLEKAGAGKQPRPKEDGYSAYMNAMAAFHTNKDAIALNHEYIKSIVGTLKESNAIFSWQISNEPRCFSSETSDKAAFVKYIHSTARLIKSIDSRHMVSTGNEGLYGCEMDMDLVRRVNDCKAIDYMTIHIWPYNWSWTAEGSIAEGVDAAIAKTEDYIDDHIKIASDLRKPMVIEEFGYPRDGFQFTKGSATSGRNALYASVFKRVVESQAEGGVLAGCNFWGWGGSAEPAHVWWEEGDDLCGDPAQEQQGLNSVFTGDSTIEVIREATTALRDNARILVPMQHDWIFKGSDKTISVSTAGSADKNIDVNLVLVTDRSLMIEADTVYNSTISVKAGKAADFDLSQMDAGFYQARVSYICEGREHHIRNFNIGIDPEDIVSEPDVDLAEFDAFWDGALAELVRVPMDAKMEIYPEYSNDVRTTYKVYVNSTDGAVMGGILCVPVKEGRYPVYMEYMGYGADVYPFDPNSYPERIQFLVSVRGQGIFREAAGRWIDRNLDNRDAYYYKGAYCDVVRAIDFVCTLPQADTTRIVALGESQGGAFTFVAAALDKRIKAAAPAVPFMGDFADYWKIVWWPVWEVFDAAKAEGISQDEVLSLMRWFDTKNFAHRITCPVKMGFGLQDPTCPPHTNFAPYNLLTSEKSYICYPYCGHGIWQIDAWREARDAWFGQKIQ